MSMCRCYAPVIALLTWAGTWQAGLNDKAAVAPWLVLLAATVVMHIRELTERRHG